MAKHALHVVYKKHAYTKYETELNILFLASQLHNLGYCQWKSLILGC